MSVEPGLVELLRTKCAQYAKAYPESLPEGWTPDTCGCERCAASDRLEAVKAWADFNFGPSDPDAKGLYDALNQGFFWWS